MSRSTLTTIVVVLFFSGLSPSMAIDLRRQAAPVSKSQLPVAPTFEPTGGTAPLTSAECRGLGGTVTTSQVCTRKGQKSCMVVDGDGVISAMCIDEVVN